MISLPPIYRLPNSFSTETTDWMWREEESQGQMLKREGTELGALGRPGVPPGGGRKRNICD